MHVKRAVAKIKDGIIAEVIRYLETGQQPRKSSGSYVEAYAAVINIADKLGQPHEAYLLYVNTLQEFVHSELSKLQQLSGESLLSSFLHSWEHHKILVFWLYKVFLYLDKYYIKNKLKDHDQSVNPLASEGLREFQSGLFEPMADSLRQTILSLVLQDREGAIVDTDIIKYVLMCFVQVGLSQVEIVKIRNEVQQEDQLMWQGVTNYLHYEAQFESAFLQETKAYYQHKTQLWIAEMTCPDYLSRAYTVIEEENKRADKYLDPKTRDLLLACVDEEVISSHAATLTDMAETGALDLLKNNRRTDLQLMFKVLKRVDSSLNHITAKLTIFIESRGRMLIEDAHLQADSRLFTIAILDLKSEIDSLLETCFENHSKFQRCRDLAFQTFLNLNPNSPLHIAGFIDYEMKTGFRGASETDVEQRLMSLLSLVVCLSDRDVFINHYTHLLAHRLLNCKSVSDEAEQMMIGKLALECGHSMVRRISGMFQDIHISKTLSLEFQSRVKDAALSVMILKTGCWPSQKALQCLIPVELQTTLHSFEEFYSSKHSGRNLRWLMGSGQVELCSIYTSRRYTFVVSPAQAAVLLLFNSIAVLSLAHIIQVTHLTPQAVQAHLHKLFRPRAKVLVKQSKDKAIEETDQIILNPEFTSTSFRVNLVPSIKIEKSEEKVKEDSEVSGLRKHVLDSVIVRVMKSRKTVSHQELLAEVMRQVTTFSPQPSAIKEQVESLIHREYIARMENNHAIYVYLP